MDKKVLFKHIKKLVFIILIWGLLVILFYIFIFLYWFVYQSYKYEKWMNRIDKIDKKDLKIALIKEEDQCMRYEIMKKLSLINDDNKKLGRKFCSVYWK